MSLMIPSHVRISRAVNIEGPKDKIISLLSDTSKWPMWNEIAYQRILVEPKAAETGEIATRWTYNGRMIESSFMLEESAGVTVVQWYFDFRLKWYPWEKFGSITFDDQFGKPMEVSLTNLKKLVENSP
jgi:hypothetical protein